MVMIAEMIVHCQPWIRLSIGYNPLYPILNPFHKPKPKLSQTLKMVATEANSKRPFCPSCSKPAQLCLCNRINTPGLDNSVTLTILQHSLERKHPLNSAKIARLGLKNLTVATVFDVNQEAQFVVRLLEQKSEMVSFQKGLDFDQAVENVETEELVFDGDGGTKVFGSTSLAHTGGERSLTKELSSVQGTQSHLKGFNFVPNSVPEDRPTVEDRICEKGIFALESPHENREPVKQSNAHMVSPASTLSEAAVDNSTIVTNESEFFHLEVDPMEAVQRGNEAPVITATIGKYGVISSLCHNWMPQTHMQKPKFSKILASSAARDALGRGFSVKKLQKRQHSASMESEECEEFELEVPPGSVLLFPTVCAIGIDGLDALDHDVKNLIVLDGTWAKAKRMYNENPWLELLPHLKLDLNKMSLYSEVRSQPKVGCLSTLESIVYTLKALGDTHEGLDNLLDVFESMVEDQRRCKDERLSKVSSV
ncbi:hypothetical protein I3843_12G127900 [Carya illinoinensis]|uniref:tRNA-uridine aminocarboxypropyltransferase n=1 Tax=Carya illinoinensis TaxID=32201 RepID=A0A922DK89_CARIL|nr:uncharacterized protein LOC122289613 [Carya illinoinensis]KAG6685743.1 hypothetical protein I3842_12G127700 [Carya illinoinensis]KAG7953786.1 hypothetical protein I3843_12G127900 [Carya illinoinensis]